MPLDRIVFRAPLFGTILDFRQTRKPVRVEQSLSDLGVQAFDMRVLRRLPWFDEV